MASLETCQQFWEGKKEEREVGRVGEGKGGSEGAREEERREMQEGGKRKGRVGEKERSTNLKAAVAFCTMVSMEMLVTCERPQPSLPRSNTCNRERPWYATQCGWYWGVLHLE